MIHTIESAEELCYCAHPGRSDEDHTPTLPEDAQLIVMCDGTVHLIAEGFKLVDGVRVEDVLVQAFAFAEFNAKVVYET